MMINPDAPHVVTKHHIMWSCWKALQTTQSNKIEEKNKKAIDIHFFWIIPTYFIFISVFFFLLLNN